MLDLFEAASGSRTMCNYMRFGGVMADLPVGWADRARDPVWNRLPRVMENFENLLTGNEIFDSDGPGDRRADCAGSCRLQHGRADAARIRRALRSAQGCPYSIYDRFEFDVCTRPEGDVWACLLSAWTRSTRASAS